MAKQLLTTLALFTAVQFLPTKIKAATVKLPDGAHACISAGTSFNLSTLLVCNVGGTGVGGSLGPGDILQIGNSTGIGGARNITLVVDANATVASIQIGNAFSGILGQGDNGIIQFNLGKTLTSKGVVTLGNKKSWLIFSNTASGAINMTAGGYLTCAGIVIGNGGAAGVGAFNSGIGTIEFTANNTLVNQANYITYNNITISAGTTSLAQAIILTGSIHLSGATSVLDVTPFSYGINMSGVGTAWTNDNATLGIGALNYRIGTVTFSGNVTVNGTGNTDFYNITIPAAGTLNSSIGNILGVWGVSWSNSGTFNHGTGTVDFKGLTVMLGTVTNTTFNNIIIDGVLTAGSGVASIINVVGNFTNNGNFINATGKVLFDGAGAQIIGGTAVTTFHKVDISNVLGSVTLNQNAIIDNTGVLNLIAGPVKINKYTLTVNNSAVGAILHNPSGYLVSEDNSTTAGKANNISYVVWAVNATLGAHVFPFGTLGGAYIPFTYNLTAGNAGNVTVSTYHATTSVPKSPMPIPVSNVNDTTYTGIDDSQYAVDRFWGISSSGGTASMTFTYDNRAVVGDDVNNLSGGVNGSDGQGLRAQQWNNGTSRWSRFYSPSQILAGNTVTIPGFSGALNNNSPWTLALRVHPLPIELLNFKASLVTSKEVQITWQTALEFNNKEFVIERSIDGANFSPIKVTKGAGNKQTISTYNIYDENPVSGTSYYRLKQIDFDGKYTLSPSVSIVNSCSINQFNFFPNPVESAVNLVFNSNENASAKLTIYDGDGRRVMLQNINIMDGANNFTYDLSTLIAGTYHFTITGENNEDVKFQGKLMKN